jgi:hypothetical protein
MSVETTGTQTLPSPRGERPTVPAVIADAGDQAVEQYRAFFDQVIKSPTTRAGYGAIIRRFFRWAEGRALSLAYITAADVVLFLDNLGPAVKQSGSADSYLAAIRSLFRHLARTGILVANPLETPHSRKMASAADRHPRPRISLSELKAMVLELDETWEEDQEFFQAGLVLLSPLAIDTIDPESISRFTGVSLPLVREFAERLLANGCWTGDGKIAVSSYDTDYCGISLVLNVMVATGIVECRPATDGDGDQAAGKTDPASEDNVPAARQEASDEK